ncbi:helix-turn-helix domain-containing protein [Streptomyces chartreusis]|uniref:Helix-turn-helix transcriptional regulator n=1 Tax=Streptomyces chartreusis TaxID=1969 RepID=A0A7H8TBI3_STRCX|nr:helix-turn-helix transcriptional regulator [Streptomyces chartreusis]QKZ20358.1 helix-turn-helix transcriptional regulator [Streptomyces chartreusis]
MPRPEKQLTPDESPRDWLGAEVRYWRKERGLRTAALAALVQVSPSLLEKIEKAQANCGQELAEQLDEVLKTGGVLTRAWKMVRRQTEKRRGETERPNPGPLEGSVHSHQGRILDSETSLPSGSPGPMYRRAFLATSGLAAFAPKDLAALVAPTAPPELPDRMRQKDIANVHAIADLIHREDNAHGGGGLVGVIASGVMQWAVTLLSVPCSEELVAPLRAAVARLGIVVGASRFDSYAHEDARIAFKLAADCAEEAGDWHLRAKAFSFLARQAIWVGDPDRGLTYAEQGLVRADRLTPTIQAMLQSARARAFGKMGNVSATLAAVGAADDAFAKSNAADDPPWMSYYNEAQHHGDTAHALYDLAVLKGQDPARASRRFEIAVDGHGDDYARSRAISGTKWASLLMAAGDPRQASAIGERALNDAGNLTSQRAADDLRELGRLARRYRGLPEAEYLRERISATLQA